MWGQGHGAAFLCGFSFCVSDLDDSRDTKKPPNSADSEIEQVTEKDGGERELEAPTGPPGLRYFKGRRGCLRPEHTVVQSRLA